MKTNATRLIALLLTLSMTVGLCSPAALAAGENENFAAAEILYDELDAELPEIPEEGFLVPVNGKRLLTPQSNGFLAEIGAVPAGAYPIGSAEELVNYVNNWGSEGYTSTYLYLTRDIDFSSYNNGNWTPLTLSADTFTLDGQGHTLKNLKLGSKTPAKCALFTSLTTSGDLTFKNLSIQNLQSDPARARNISGAGLVYTLSTGGTASISNCYVTGAADMRAFAGFVGTTTGTCNFTDCYAQFTLNAASASVSHPGFYGLCGGTAGTVERCFAQLMLKGAPTGSSDFYFAGLTYSVSHLKDSYAKLQSHITELPAGKYLQAALLTHTLTGTAENCFGILGDIYTKNSYSSVDIGGIAITCESACAIDSCYALLDVENINTLSSNIYGVARTTWQTTSLTVRNSAFRIIGSAVGTYAGICDENLTLAENCRVELNIPSISEEEAEAAYSYTYVYGLGSGNTARNCSIRVTANAANSYVYGLGKFTTASDCSIDIQAQGDTVYGLADFTPKQATRCAVSGTLEGNQTSGLARYADKNTTLDGCSFIGTITAKETYSVGGLIAEAKDGVILKHCVVSADITAGCRRMGGLVGESGLGLGLYQCFYSGNLRPTMFGGNNYGATLEAGGLVGRVGSNDSKKSTILSCGVSGSLVAYSGYGPLQNAGCYVGGIAGKANDSASNGYNTGIYNTISAMDVTAMEFYGMSFSYFYAGGLVGSGPISCGACIQREPTLICWDEENHDNHFTWPIAPMFQEVNVSSYPWPEEEEELPALSLTAKDGDSCWYAIDEESGLDNGLRLTVSAILGQEYLPGDLTWTIEGTAIEMSEPQELKYTSGNLYSSWVELKGVKLDGTATITCSDNQGNSASATITVVEVPKPEPETVLPEVFHNPTPYRFEEPRFQALTKERGNDAIVINGQGVGYFYLDVYLENGKWDPDFDKALYYKLQKLDPDTLAFQWETRMLCTTPIADNSDRHPNGARYLIQTPELDSSAHFNLIIYDFDVRLNEEHSPIAGFSFPVKVTPLVTWHQNTFTLTGGGSVDLSEFDPRFKNWPIKTSLGADVKPKLDFVHEYTDELSPSGEQCQSLTITLDLGLAVNAEGKLTLGDKYFKDGTHINATLQTVAPELNNLLNNPGGKLEFNGHAGFSYKLTHLTDLASAYDRTAQVVWALMILADDLLGTNIGADHETTTYYTVGTGSKYSASLLRHSGYQSLSRDARHVFGSEEVRHTETYELGTSLPLAIAVSPSQFVSGKLSGDTPASWVSKVKYLMTKASDLGGFKSMVMRYCQGYDVAADIKLKDVMDLSFNTTSFNTRVFHYDLDSFLHLYQNSSKFQDLWIYEGSGSGLLHWDVRHKFAFHSDLWKETAQYGEGLICENVFTAEGNFSISPKTLFDDSGAPEGVSFSVKGAADVDMEYTNSRGILGPNNMVYITSTSSDKMKEKCVSQQNTSCAALYECLKQGLKDYVSGQYDAVLDSVGTSIDSTAAYLAETGVFSGSDSALLTYQTGSGAQAATLFEEEAALTPNTKLWVAVTDGSGNSMDEFEGLELHLKAADLLGETEITDPSKLGIFFRDPETGDLTLCPTTYNAGTGMATASVTRTGEYELIYDDTAPTLINPTVWFGGGLLSVYGSYLDDTGLDPDSVTVTSEDEAFELWAATCSAGSFDLMMYPWETGTHTITINARDLMGNAAAPLTMDISYYGADPAIGSITAPASVDAGDALTISAQVDNADSVQILYGEADADYLSGCVDMVLGGNGLWSAQIPDPERYAALTFRIQANGQSTVIGDPVPVTILPDFTALEEQMERLEWLAECYDADGTGNSDATRSIIRLIEEGDALMAGTPTMDEVAALAARMKTAADMLIPENGILFSGVETSFDLDGLNVQFRVTNTNGQAVSLSAVAACFEEGRLVDSTVLPIQVDAEGQTTVSGTLDVSPFRTTSCTLKLFFLSNGNLIPVRAVSIDAIRK